MAMLIVRTGGVDQVVELGERTLIGRHASNDVQILDTNVSARHCLIEIREGAYHVRDLNSLNGTLVNRTRNDGNAERLFHEDLISVGETTMCFYDEPSGLRPEDDHQFLEGLRREFRKRFDLPPAERPHDVSMSAWRQPDPDGDLDADRATLRIYWETTQALLQAPNEQVLVDAAVAGAIRLSGARGGALRLHGHGGACAVSAMHGAGPSQGGEEDVERARSRQTAVVRRSSRPDRPWRVVIPVQVADEHIGMMTLEAKRGSDIKHVLLAETVANLAAALLPALSARQQGGA